MQPVSKVIHDEMLELGLLNIEVIRDYNGNTIWEKQIESKEFKKVIHKRVQVANKNKGAKAKTYFVEEPIYKQYLQIKQQK